MKLLLVLSFVLIAPLIRAFGDPTSNKLDIQFPSQNHLTASQLHQLGGTPNAKDKIIGQFVLLNVVVTVEREVPLVEVMSPKEPTGDSAQGTGVFHAHLISATTEASSLKKGERLRIEGIIVGECYEAYTIYLLQAKTIE